MTRLKGLVKNWKEFGDDRLPLGAIRPPFDLLLPSDIEIWEAAGFS